MARRTSPTLSSSKLASVFEARLARQRTRGLGCDGQRCSGNSRSQRATPRDPHTRAPPPTPPAEIVPATTPAHSDCLHRPVSSTTAQTRFRRDSGTAPARGEEGAPYGRIRSLEEMGRSAGQAASHGMRTAPGRASAVSRHLSGPVRHAHGPARGLGHFVRLGLGSRERGGRVNGANGLLGWDGQRERPHCDWRARSCGQGCVRTLARR